VKNILLIIALAAIFMAAVYLDNHLPGYAPTQTRQHP
jgi:hypothetical protein